jgi:Na+-transporting methylmalonyl-CoA/oxaloacetate decarboxylase gamma subunit
MKPAVFVGVVLIVLSILSFAYQGITYTSREKVLKVGPIEATAEKQKTIPLPPIFGGIALVGGVVLVIVGNRR